MIKRYHNIHYIIIIFYITWNKIETDIKIETETESQCNFLTCISWASIHSVHFEQVVEGGFIIKLRCVCYCYIPAGVNWKNTIGIVGTVDGVSDGPIVTWKVCNKRYTRYYEF